MNDFFLRQHDTRPVIDATFEDANGAIDLTDASCLFVFRPRWSGVATTGTATILSAVSGMVRYTMTSGNSATANVFYGEFRATLTGGNTLTIPNSAPFTFEIIERLIGN